MYKDFNKWNSEKKIVNKKYINRNLFFYEREIWWCSVGLNIGVEADGKNDNFERPMLIIKKFNSEMLWVLPLTTKEKNGIHFYALHHEDLKTSIVLTQIKTISTKRLLRKIGIVSDFDFLNIIEKIIHILKNENPLSGVISEAKATNT